MAEQWAHDRVRQLVDAQTKPGWHDEHTPSGVANAFARYIEEHEEEPVDQLVADMADAIRHFFPNDLGIYKRKDSGPLPVAERFISDLRRRGIEIGKASA